MINFASFKLSHKFIDARIIIAIMTKNFNSILAIQPE